MSTLAHTLIEAGLRHRLVTARILAGPQQTGNTSVFGGFDQTIEITALDQSLGNGAAIELAALKVAIQSDSNFE